MHVESCLAYALQDTYRPDPGTPPAQPWFGLWKPPNPSRKPLLICGSGPTLAAATRSALSRLQVHHREIGTPQQITLWRAQDPRNPLWTTMIGDRSTPNQIAQGIALRVAVAHYFNPADLPAATASALRFLTLQTTRGMMSVQHGPRIISEFNGPSHMWIWFLAYAHLRHTALRIKEPALVDATSRLWSQLVAYMSLAGTPDGLLLCAGPRAWSAPEAGKPLPKRFSFLSAAGNAIYCELFHSNLRWPTKKLIGLDMLGAVIVRDLRNKATKTSDPLVFMDRMADEGLPDSLDPITIARGPGSIAVWLTGDTCTNMTRPGPLWWSMWAGGKLTYGTEPTNSAPAHSIYPFRPEERDRSPSSLPWQHRTQIRSVIQ